MASIAEKRILGGLMRPSGESLTDEQASDLDAALREHQPWTGVDEAGDPLPDTRTLTDLVREDVGLYLRQRVYSHRQAEARRQVPVPEW